MIGDADNFIHGINIIEKEKWDQEIQEFRNIFGIDTTHEYEFTDCIEYIGDYMWNAILCSEEEKKLFEKFMPTGSFGRFLMPSYFKKENVLNG